MPSPEPAGPKTSVDDIWAFNDDELVKYMKQRRLPNGGFELAFDGSTVNLSEEQRAQLAERLK